MAALREYVDTVLRCVDQGPQPSEHGVRAEPDAARDLEYRFLQAVSDRLELACDARTAAIISDVVRDDEQGAVLLNYQEQMKGRYCAALSVSAAASSWHCCSRILSMRHRFPR